VEGMLIEQLRQITFKIKVMDYISRRAFAVSSQEKKESIIVDLKRISEVNSSGANTSKALNTPTNV
jgi:hypothetical protein